MSPGPAPYALTIYVLPAYLHAKVVGERTPENARRYFEEVHAACVKHDCWKTLLEMNFTGPSMNTTDIYRVISGRSMEGAKLRKIAYVDSSVDQEQAKFAETVAINRAVKVRLFNTIADAARWLEEPP